MLKVLIVDDHAVVRVGIRGIIEEAFEDVVIGEASNGPEAMNQARRESWDLVLLDITMPGPNGVQVLRQLRQEQPSQRVIMLSMHAGMPYVMGSLKAGAIGYLSKEHAPVELVEAINAALAGRVYVSSDIMQEMDVER